MTRLINVDFGRGGTGIVPGLDFDLRRNSLVSNSDLLPPLCCQLAISGSAKACQAAPPEDKKVAVVSFSPLSFLRITRMKAYGNLHFIIISAYLKATLGACLYFAKPAPCA